jgi:hypothetical protein
VIAVFTKYDQFKRDVEMKLEDEDLDPEAIRANLDAEIETLFRRHYLSRLEGSVPYVRLERKDFVNQLACITLISVPQKCTSLANDVQIFLK